MQQRDERVARITLKDGRVLLISNLVITQRYLHPDYIFTPGPGAVSESGLITVFEVLQKDEGIPSFTGRWDGSRAHRQPLELDIDISGVPIGVIRKFRNNSDGYNTRHADNSPDASSRLYEVRIETPSGLIFDGDISFFNTYEQQARADARISAAVDSAVQSAEILTPMPRRPARKPAAALSAPRNPHAVAWLQEKLRSCLTFLGSRRH